MQEDKTKCLNNKIVTKEKCCIIGCSDSKTLAPIDNQSYDLIGVNNLFLTLPDAPWSYWFEIHDIDFDGFHFTRRGKRDFRGLLVDTYLEKISELKCPVFMQKKWHSIPNSVVYPKDEILKRFGRYFTNTISWQIAWAIHQGYKEIAIYGVDMAVGTEYAKQRPSCEYFIGLAHGLGIKVILPDEADLMKNRYLYAFEEKKETAFKKKVKHTISSMNTRLQQAQMQQIAANKQTEQYIGAITALNEMMRIWDVEK